MKSSEVVAGRIADHIIDEDLPPGTRLPPEHEMVAAFGVGRSTVREALRLLESHGVITIKRGPGGGPVVRRPDSDDFGQLLVFILQFKRASLRDVLDARSALEPTIARLAATRITDGQVDLLQASIDRMREGAGDHSVFVEQNWIFHSTVSLAASSLVLQLFIDSLKSIFDGEMVGVTYDARRHLAIAEAHERIVLALRERDEELASQAMNEHLDEAARYWGRKYEPLMSQGLRWIR